MEKNEKKKTVLIMENEVYSRVCGYCRPINSYNKGKYREFQDRNFLKLPQKLRGKND